VWRQQQGREQQREEERVVPLLQFVLLTERLCVIVAQIDQGIRKKERFS